jgi:ankyrin repeat protein
MDKNIIGQINRALSFLKNADSEGFKDFTRKHPEVLIYRSGDFSLLHEACFISKEACKMAVDCGADVNLTDSVGATVLNICASQGDLEMVDFLLQKGAIVDAPESLGETALSWAIVQGHLEVAQLLIKHGANLNHQISKTPRLRVIDLAKQSKNEGIRLLAAGQGFSF